MLTAQDKTIVAIATPIGTGGVAMIRISGKKAFEVGQKIFSKDLETIPSHQMVYGKILNSKKVILDDVMLVKLVSPKSFTGENTIEIFCHGSLIIQRNIVNCCIEAGAEAALPGEFSYQAFMNGKMDLAQAEAIQELIGAKNNYALKAAEEQLKGSLSLKIKAFQSSLLESAAIIDAWVDYPEEGLEFKTKEEILLDLKTVLNQMNDLKNSFHDGQKLNLNIKLCLLGAPNAGKSSLMNALLGYDRAIVTPIAGTTRDLLQEDLYLFGMNFSLIDTAGIRKTAGMIEKEGIKRSLAAAENADLILYVIDSSKEISPQEIETISNLPTEKTIIIYNKSDLVTPKKQFAHLCELTLSTKKMQGLEELKQAIESKVMSSVAFDKDQVIITKQRHHDAIIEAIENLTQVILGLESDLSAEFISFDLRMSLKALGKIIGFDLSESILDSIFSKFCVGK